MKKLFVCQSIDIAASPSKVWAILIQPKYTDQWSSAFGDGSALQISSDWKLNSRVLWKDPEGKVIVDGEVTAGAGKVCASLHLMCATTRHLQLAEKTASLISLRQKKVDYRTMHGDFGTSKMARFTGTQC
jgi:hypothetical protein